MTTIVLIAAAAVVPLIWGYFSYKLMVKTWPRRRERPQFEPSMEEEPHIEYQI